MSFKNTLTPLLIAVQFLTRIPVSFLLSKNQTEIYTPANLSRTLKYYPLVGLIIGLLLGFLVFVLQSFALEHTLYIAGLVVTLWVVITGGLHLDGVADMTDAWIGGLGDKQRTLEIMKDPVCGPFAVIAIVLVILLKIVFVYEILQYNPYLLIAAPFFSRSMVVILLMTTPYVREGGTGSNLNMPTEKYKNILSLGVFLVGGFYFFTMLTDGLVVTAVGVINLLFLLFFRHNVINRIAGITGDTAGAFIEYTELVVLLGFVTGLIVTTPV